jgi:hypothetical protein
MIVLAVVLLLALIAVGAKSLLSVIVSDGAPAEALSSAAPATTGGASPSASRVPTVRIVCQADRCPIFVRMPGGDVLVDRDLTRGEQASYFDPELDVVLDDASTVMVFENGTARPPGEPGGRQTFSVTRAPGQ